MAALNRTFSRLLTWKISSCQFPLSSLQPPAPAQPLLPNHGITLTRRQVHCVFKDGRVSDEWGEFPGPRGAPCPYSSYFLPNQFWFLYHHEQPFPALPQEGKDPCAIYGWSSLPAGWVKVSGRGGGERKGREGKKREGRGGVGKHKSKEGSGGRDWRRLC